MDLIGESPEAQEFFRSVASDIGRYLLFPDEHFTMIRAGILATSAVDRQNEIISPNCLESMAAQINKNSLWMLREHNPLLGIIGRVLAAGRFYAPGSGIYFVATVNGFYDLDRLPGFQDLGVDISPPTESAYDLPETERIAEARLGYSPHEIPETAVEEMLEQAPEFVARDAALQGRKSAEPTPILTVLASVWLLISNPFSKKFLERFGEKSGDAAIAFLSWLKDRVFTKVAQLNPKTLFVLETAYKGCRVEFVTSSTDPAILIEATQCVHGAAQSAVALVDKLEHLGVQKLIYEYHLPTRKWLPLHAATRGRGVISDRPALIALDQFKPAKQDNGAPTTLVFQYGSNCLDSEINSRSRLCGDAKFVGIAETVEDFELAFDVQSVGRGCAASDIVRKQGGKVWGVLYEVPDYLVHRNTARARGRKSLDAIEGEGKNYKRETIKVRLQRGEIVPALTYTVKDPKPGLKTNIGYLRRIVCGLREHRVEDEYIAKVKSIAAANNSDIAAEVEKL
jgi:cation transport regulator ChaC